MNCQILFLAFILIISLTESRKITESNSWIHRSYGKSNVKLLHVRKDGPLHTIHEFEVNTQLTLATDKEYVDGVNSDVIATDSQKNIVYLVAKKNGIASPEVFALQLVEHFLDKYQHITAVKIEVKEHPWRRMAVDGKAHNHAFISYPEVTHFCIATQNRGEPVVLTSGLDGLQVLKTTQSGFVNFVSDEYRTLPDMEDRILSVSISAYWTYNSLGGVKFDVMRKRIMNTILDKFAGPPDIGIFSSSVQNTIYVTQKAILNLCLVKDIEITMTNNHYFSIDLSKFPDVGYAENNEVFLPADNPFGTITAKLEQANICPTLQNVMSD